MKQFDKAVAIAKSLQGQKQTGRSFHATFVFEKSKLIVVGINNYNKHHPWHKFGKYIPLKPEIQGQYIPCLHSEIDALTKLDRGDYSKLTFLNIRIDNRGVLANAKPCGNCERVLETINYKQFIYYNGKELIKTTKQKL